MTRWWVRIIRHAPPPASAMALIAVLLLLSSVLTALAPWPLKLLMDCVLKPIPEEQQAHAWLNKLPGAGSTLGLIAWLAAAGPILYFSGRLVQVLQNYIVAGIGSRMTYQLGAELLDRLQELSLVFHSRQRVGDLVRRVTTDCGCARDLICSILLPAASAVVGLVMMFAIMWQLDPMLSLIAISFAVPLAILIRVLAKPMADRSYEQQELSGRMMALAEQTLGAVSIVQSFTREGDQDKQYVALSRATLRASLRSMLAQLQFKFGTSGITALGNATIVLVGGWLVVRGPMSLGDLMVFLAYVASLYAPLETLAYLGSGFAAASGSARRVLDILESVERVTEQPDARPLLITSNTRGLQIQFEQVTFGYRRDEPVLRGIDLEIPAGQVVALIGPTGVGKSTLASMVPRLFDPWNGAIRISGNDLRRLTLLSLRRQIAVVPQEPLLLPLSIAQNIAYGRPGASLEDIRFAAEAAGAAEYIERLPQKYNHVIAERGASLSVGQRQRLAIARAILKDAPILILDEPTSALDSSTEQEVVAGLDRLMQGRTCIIIAHRLSSIRRANRIIVLENGGIVQDGTHTELLRQSGLYQHLVHLQSGAPSSLAGVTS